MKSQALHTVWCNISGEAAGEIQNWSLLGEGYAFEKHISKRGNQWIRPSINQEIKPSHLSDQSAQRRDNASRKTGQGGKGVAPRGSACRPYPPHRRSRRWPGRGSWGRGAPSPPTGRWSQRLSPRPHCRLRSLVLPAFTRTEWPKVSHNMMAVALVVIIL